MISTQTPWEESPFGKYSPRFAIYGQNSTGISNVMLSIMPARVLRLLSVFGYTCDRKFGLDRLQQTLEIGGVHRPMALFLYLLLDY